MFKIKHYNIISPFNSTKKNVNIKNWEYRINERILKGGICLIVIDGMSQSGKSTLGEWICRNFDITFNPELQIVYEPKQIIDYLKYIKEKWYGGEKEKILNKWIFWDEPQVSIPKQKFWDERNQIARDLTSTWGFLKQHLVMALPNISGISDTILTNILFRIHIKMFLTEKGILRIAYCKTPYYNEYNKKWYWITFQQFLIPNISFSEIYYNKKIKNFFENLLPKWEKILNE